MDGTATVQEMRRLFRLTPTTLYKLIANHGIRPVGIVQMPGDCLRRGPKARTYRVAAVAAVVPKPRPAARSGDCRRPVPCRTKPPDEVTDRVEPEAVPQAEPEYPFGGGGLTFTRRDLDEMARRRAKFQPQGVATW